MTYSALPIDDVVESLINQEKNRINDLEENKHQLMDLFQKIPSFGAVSDKKGNQFQIISGIYQINNKIKEMISQSKTQFLLTGSENEFMHFYRDGIFELLKNKNLDVKVLASNSKKIQYILQGIKKDCIKIVSEKDNHDLCFMIKDENEIIFFMKDKTIKENQIAIWSDSSSIVTSLDLLFNIIWHGDKTVEANRYALLEKMQEYRFKIKEIEQENIGLTTLNKLLTNNRN